MSLNHELADVFARMSSVMQIKGENQFKAIAFAKVGRILNDMAFDVRKCVEDNTLCDMEGIGSSSQKIIEEYVKTGRSVDHDELLASVPPGLLEMLHIPSMGPKTIAQLWNDRNITNIADLVKAIDDGKLEGLKGIGEKKIQAIKQGIAMRSQAAQRMRLGEAWPVAELLLMRLRDLPPVRQAEVAGSLRRRKESIGDVDLICSLKEDKSGAASAGPAVSAAFVKFPEVERIQGQGATKASVITAGGLQVDLRIVPADNFGAAVLYFTGSKDHNVRLRGRAQDLGMTLNEWGLYKLDEYDRAAKKTAQAPPIKPVASKTETDVYKKLGLAYIEPELREDRGEVDAAASAKLPKLISLEDIRGDLHTHTTASDGANSIEEMAEAAKSLGYSFLAITDHSKSQVIANGLSVERLLKHVNQIRKIASKLKGITLLAGAEVDILADGRLDYEDAVLADLDIVVASPHLALKQDEKKATDRILRAIDNRYVTLIGHPTGRIINARPGLPLDFPRIYKAAAQSGTALEINSGYPRLDLNDIHARGAVEAGVTLSINTDAHSTGELAAQITFGIGQARRAWVEPKHVINCMSTNDLKTFISHKRP